MNRLLTSYRYFLGLAVVFAILIFVLPANHITKSAYNLTSGEYHILLLLVEVPIIATWFAAFYGYRALKSYTRLITETPEGNDFRSMSHGMAWVAWGLAVPAVVTLVLNAIANAKPAFHSTALIIGNYLYVIVAIMAFNHISSGTRSLAQRSKVFLDSKSSKWLTLFFVVMGVLFCYFVFSKLHTIHLGDSYNAFYLPNWLICLTLIIPYLYAWFVGLLAAFELVMLARNVSGVLYKQALQLLATGLVLVIVASSALQYFRTIVPRTGHLAIGSSLLFVYLTYAVNAAGGIVMAIGAKRLKKIEEV